MTAQELGDEVLKLVDAVAEADTPTAAQRAVALAILNAMLDTWNADGLLVPYEQVTAHTLTIDDLDYTIGATGNIATARPIDIKKAQIRDSSNQDRDIDIISFQQYQDIANKSSYSGVPSKLVYQKTPTNGTILLWPKPDAAYSLRLTYDAMFGTFVAGTSIDNNPGYLEAMKYNQAIRVAEYYKRKPSEMTIVLADSSLRTLRKRAAGVNIDAPVNHGILRNPNGGYDIRRGY